MSARAVKSCLELYREHNKVWREEYDRYHRAIFEAKNREFPVGTKVRFAFGRGYIEAEVVELPTYPEDSVIVKNIKTGKTWQKEVQDLEHVA